MYNYNTVASKMTQGCALRYPSKVTPQQWNELERRKLYTLISFFFSTDRHTHKRKLYVSYNY